MHNNILKEGESDNKTCAFTCAHGMQENYIYIYRKWFYYYNNQLSL